MTDISRSMNTLRTVLDAYNIIWRDKTVVTFKNTTKTKMKYEEVHLETTSFSINRKTITAYVGYGVMDDNAIEWFNYGVPGDPENYIYIKIEDPFNDAICNEYIYSELASINKWIEDQLI